VITTSPYAGIEIQSVTVQGWGVKRGDKLFPMANRLCLSYSRVQPKEN
jgi:hypothetical protein